MDSKNVRPSKWPGYIALVLITITNSLWTFWGIAEMYYEGWGNPRHEHRCVREPSDRKRDNTGLSTVKE